MGKCFATYLKLNYSELAGKYKSYKHKFPSGMELDARQYENALLPILFNMWMKSGFLNTQKNISPQEIRKL